MVRVVIFMVRLMVVMVRVKVVMLMVREVEKTETLPPVTSVGEVASGVT